MHVEPVTSTKKRKNLVRGHCWVELGVVVNVPWSRRAWFIPLLSRLYRGKKEAGDDYAQRSASWLASQAGGPGLRRFLLLSADALVVVGLMESRRVEKIRVGSGLTDMAQDFLDPGPRPIPLVWAALPGDRTRGWGVVSRFSPGDPEQEPGETRCPPPWSRAGWCPWCAQRKPRLLLRFDGVFLLRLAPRTLEALLLFQLPPRLTRVDCPGVQETMPNPPPATTPATAVEQGYLTFLWLDERIASFPQLARRLLGQRLASATLDALVATTEAVYLRGPRRIARLEDTNRHLTVGRILLRVCRDRRHFSVDQHEHALRLVDDWGRQIGGLLRVERERLPRRPAGG
jgi:hypothetical protein